MSACTSCGSHAVLQGVCASCGARSQRAYSRGTAPYQKKSATSKAGAEHAAAKVGKQEQAILDWLLTRGTYGATRKEIAAALGFPEASVDARIGTLRSAGLVRDAGKRPGPFGVANAVVVAVAADAPATVQEALL